jgi:hypothetical protein
MIVITPGLILAHATASHRVFIARRTRARRRATAGHRTPRTPVPGSSGARRAGGVTFVAERADGVSMGAILDDQGSAESS